MTREDLEKLELNEEQITGVMKLKSAVFKETDSTIDDLRGKVKTLTTDKESLQTKVDSLEKGQPDLEAIKQEQFDLGKAEGSEELETFKKNVALEKALSTSKAKDLKIIQNLLDNEKLTFEDKDGEYTITGLDEQLKDLKEKKSFLFEEEKKEEPGLNLGGGHGDTPPNNEPTDLAGALREKYETK